MIDTHAWLWFLTSDERLGSKAKQIFEETEEGEETLVLPSIVVAESVYIIDKKGYSIVLRDIIEDIEISSNYIIRPMDISVLKSLSRDDRDLSIHDKIIVITAENENIGIISRDEAIKKKAKVHVIW